MKKIFLLLIAVGSMLMASAQTKIKVTEKNGASYMVSDQYEIDVDQFAKNVTIGEKALPFNDLERITFQRDDVQWNLHWKAIDNNRHNQFGYGSIMHVRDVMTEDLFREDSGYNWFSAWGKNTYQGIGYVNSAYIWGFMRDLILEANEWIEVASDKTDLEGMLGAAYATRAMLYLDAARMYEFLPNDRTSSIAASGESLIGLTVPIITESAPGDTRLSAYNKPRASKAEMVAFIQNDLDKAEQLIAKLKDDSHLLPHLDVIYGLKARLNLWAERYQEAQAFARKAIEAATTTPMLRDDLQNVYTGFNDVTKWMWGVKYFSGDEGIQNGLLNWSAWMSTEYTDGYAYYVPTKINKSLYEKISDTDIRKLLWIAPDGSALAGKTPLVEDLDLPYYASVKFRPSIGPEYQDKIKTAYPLMRVEEMYFIEAEAAAQQGNTTTASTLLNQFMRSYRDANYNTNATSKNDIINEIILQKRIELWGEGQTFFDVKRLDMSVTRKYDGTNIPYSQQFNTQGRPAWMNLVFPSVELQINAGIEDTNNPDPSDVYLYDAIIDAEMLKANINGEVILQTPAFASKINVLPLDSVYYLLMHYTMPQYPSNATMCANLQVSLSADFPKGQTQTLMTQPGVNEANDLNVQAVKLSNNINYLLEQQGRKAQGETPIYMRLKVYCTQQPSVQLYSNTINFKVSVSEKPSLKYGYSYDSGLKAKGIGEIDIEKLAGNSRIQMCKVENNLKGKVSSNNNSRFYLVLGYNDNNYVVIDSDGYMDYDPTMDGIVRILKNSFLEYPGTQNFKARVETMVDLDDLRFYAASNRFDLKVKPNKQAWTEVDYQWDYKLKDAVLTSQRGFSGTMSYYTSVKEDAFLMLAPYSKGHNLIFKINENNAITVDKQYAYDTAEGETFWVSGTGTFNDSIFDMQMRFENADGSKSEVCHEVIDVLKTWQPLFMGVLNSSFFGDKQEAVVYKHLSADNKYKLEPFLDSKNGLVFNWNQSNETLAFDETAVYVHPTYGDVRALDNSGTSYSKDSLNNPFFNFIVKYVVDAGSFGTFEESFQVTSMVGSWTKRTLPEGYYVTTSETLGDKNFAVFSALPNGQLNWFKLDGDGGIKDEQTFTCEVNGSIVRFYNSQTGKYLIGTISSNQSKLTIDGATYEKVEHTPELPDGFYTEYNVLPYGGTGYYEEYYFTIKGNTISYTFKEIYKDVNGDGQLTEADFITNTFTGTYVINGNKITLTYIQGGEKMVTTLYFNNNGKTITFGELVFVRN